MNRPTLAFAAPSDGHESGATPPGAPGLFAWSGVLLWVAVVGIVLQAARVEAAQVYGDVRATVKCRDQNTCKDKLQKLDCSLSFGSEKDPVKLEVTMEKTGRDTIGRIQQSYSRSIDRSAVATLICKTAKVSCKVCQLPVISYGNSPARNDLDFADVTLQ